MLPRHHRKYLTFVVTLLFMTVGSSARAAVDSPSPDFEDKDPTEVSSPEKDALRDSLSIAQPAPAPPQERGEDVFYYRYHRSTTFRLGEAMDSKAQADGKGLLSVLGAQYLFSLDGFFEDLDQRFSTFEAGADLLSDGTGDLHVQQRYGVSQTRFRPYAKWGLGVRIVPSDQLITFLKYEHYQVRGAVGFEEWVGWPRRSATSVRGELETAISGDSVQVIVSVGAVWAF